jgi:hypothetical protein
MAGATKGRDTENGFAALEKTFRPVSFLLLFAASLQDKTLIPMLV